MLIILLLHVLPSRIILGQIISVAMAANYSEGLFGIKPYYQSDYQNLPLFYIKEDAKMI